MTIVEDHSGFAGVADNAAAQRFELDIDGSIVFARYQREGTDRLVISHVEAPPELRGTGAAGRLMEGVTAIALSEGRKIVPSCGYAASWLKRRKDHRDLIA